MPLAPPESELAVPSCRPLLSKKEQSPHVVPVKEKALFWRLSQYAWHNKPMMTADIASI